MLMVRAFVVFIVVLSAIVTPYTIAQSSTLEEPILSGYVTRGVSLSDFDVDGWTVSSDAKTTFSQSMGAPASMNRITGGKVYLGEHVSLFGKKNFKRHRVEAHEVIFLRPSDDTLSGLAVVDHIFPADGSSVLLLRADGYVMKLEKTTVIDSSSLIKTPADVKVGDWIGYNGVLGSSGILKANKVAFYQSYVSDREGKLIATTDYDASAIPDDAKQNIFSKALIGLDPKKVPPYHDAALQSRVDRIGQTLIPAYQRTLSDTDPRKVHFQFQLIDDKKWKDALALPSGIILIPRQIVERLQDDSQLAVVLADNIATVLEKQSYRLLPASTALAVVNGVSLVGGFFVPGLGLVGSGATGLASHKINVDQLNQSGRVSLCLMHDAGYDITQAPGTWWTLASKPSKPLTNTSIPARSTNLYRTIGIVWNSYPATSSPSPSTATIPANSSNVATQ